MTTWYRVFGTDPAEPDPAALLDHLRAGGFEVRGQFHGDDQGWFRAELADDRSALALVERYLTSEEGIRDELNTWAAWVEDQGEGRVHTRLMQHLISTAQLFTLRPADDVDEPGRAEGVCLAACRFLAGRTGGAYQVDEQGFFGADGGLLLRE